MMIWYNKTGSMAPLFSFSHAHLLSCWSIQTNIFVPVAVCRLQIATVYAIKHQSAQSLIVKPNVLLKARIARCFPPESAMIQRPKRR